MVIACENCGSDRFRAGEIELNPQGGFTVSMPCAKCGTPSKVIQDNDPEFAQLLGEFFASDQSDGPNRFTHDLS
jgi:DNA-directed RNA polymerase subunit RPC12/RpoP